MKKFKKGITGKKYANRAHFKKRVKERLGITINRKDIRELIYDIENNNIISWTMQSRRVVSYNMKFKGIRCFIKYDQIRKTPITVVTVEMDENPLTSPENRV